MDNLSFGSKNITKEKKLNQKLRLIAFYLTQFHPTKENDEWWGKGFTEWTNVTKSEALFDGHYQPHLPSDFGFYDLRLRETRREQIKTAKKFGIDAFCYHYYWFSGTRLLNQPLDDMLADNESDMPFCLCWANENWTRRWDAADQKILIAQKYLPDDDLNFIKSLMPFFLDSRYIKLDGAPFLIVYRPQHLPDAKKTLQIWRDYCESQGIENIHICAALTHGNEDYLQYGFDSGVEFPPHNLKCESITQQIIFDQAFSGNVFQYETVANSYLERSYPGSRVHKGVFPCWDNTARTQSRSLIVLNGTPMNYEYWLAKTIERTSEEDGTQEKLVFINAWNEWAEGCHLEPDRKYQKQFLEATFKAKNNLSKLHKFEDNKLPSQINTNKRTLLNDLLLIVRYHSALLIGRLSMVIKKNKRLRKLVRYVLSIFK